MQWVKWAIVLPLSAVKAERCVANIYKVQKILSTGLSSLREPNLCSASTWLRTFGTSITIRAMLLVSPSRLASFRDVRILTLELVSMQAPKTHTGLSRSSSIASSWNTMVTLLLTTMSQTWMLASWIAHHSRQKVPLSSNQQELELEEISPPSLLAQESQTISATKSWMP